MEYRTDNICRTCLDETENLRNLFRDGQVCGETTTLSNMLHEISALEVNQNDPLPQNICSKCVVSLSKAYIFRRTCIESESCLQERLRAKQADEDDIIGTFYFYDETETENVVDECHVQTMYESGNVKQENVTYESNSACEEDEEVIEDGSYEQLEVSEDNDPIDEEEEEYGTQLDHQTLSIEVQEDVQKSPKEPVTYTLELNDSVENKSNSQKTRKRSKRYSGPPYKCEICGKVLSNHSSYKYHMQLHSDKTPFLCSECGEGFKTRNAYEGHMTTHDKNNPNKCNVCGKVYRQASSLRSHMQTHTGEKPFQCRVCGKGITQKSGYKKHMLTHTGEKPHTCDICGSSFRFSSNLITHRRRHTGEKPYVCNTCGKAFVGGEQLKRHLATHSKGKQYKCDICPQVFNRKGSYHLHRNTQHSNEKKFACKICGISYAQMKGLIRHMLVHKDCYEDVETLELQNDNNEAIQEIQDH